MLLFGSMTQNRLKGARGSSLFPGSLRSRGGAAPEIISDPFPHMACVSQTTATQVSACLWGGNQEPQGHSGSSRRKDGGNASRDSRVQAKEGDMSLYPKGGDSKMDLCQVVKKASCPQRMSQVMKQIQIHVKKKRKRKNQ